MEKSLEQKYRDEKLLLEDYLNSLVSLQNENFELFRVETKLNDIERRLRIQIEKNEQILQSVNRIEMEISILKSKINKSKQEQHFYNKYSEKIYKSRFWRITAPLRKFGKLIRLR